MLGKLYTVEIIIDRKGKLNLIEMNGCDSGLETFRDEGCKAERAVLSRMKRLAQGKPIYSEYSAGERTALGRILVNTQPSYRRLLPSSMLWSTGDVFHDYLQEAAYTAGIKYVPFTDCAVNNGTVSFVVQGSRKNVQRKDIGAIWLEDRVKRFKDTNAYDELLVNPYVIEKILDNKLYCHKLLLPALKEHLPQTVALLPGKKPRRLPKGRMLVIKPNMGSKGYGVEIRARGCAAKYDANMPDAEIMSDDPLEAMFEPWCTLLQTFVESKPCRKWQSVLRALVFNRECLYVLKQFCRPDSTSCIDIRRTSGREEQKGADFAESCVRALESRVVEEGLREQTKFDSWRRRVWDEAYG
ncbi:hypothetical protein HY642_05505 [Candidatus Woesearchaeota archaeon]|nr:hypothetical protein [Candidatus Woesearchaeota archaeon]